MNVAQSILRAAKDIRSPSTNIVHLAQQGERHDRLKQLSPRLSEELLSRAPRQAASRRATCLSRPAPSSRPAREEAVEGLLEGLGIEDPDCRRYLLEDICAHIEAFGSELGYERVNVKLEVLGGTKCPRWHADHVTLRLLVTYVGPGTQFIENKHVNRVWEWDSDGNLLPVVASVDESHLRRAGSGDVVVLKGHKWGGDGSYIGLGAVHRSPDPDEDYASESGGLRLLLTIDDVIPLEHDSSCQCGHAH